MADATGAVAAMPVWPPAWAFVGPTTAYAAMEAMGLVNDHLDGCHVREAAEVERARFDRPTPRTR